MKFYNVLLFLTITQFSIAQCPNGSLVFITQESLDQFIIDYPNCEEIDGILSIFESDVTSLLPLKNIKRINGNFNLNDNLQLLNFEGLESLEYIEGGWTISRCPLIKDFSCLGSLKRAATIIVSFNNGLESFDGLESFECISNRFVVQGNVSLTNIDAIGEVNSLPELRLIDNEKLARLPRLNKLLALGQPVDFNLLQIIDNISLVSLKGLDSLQILTTRLDVIGNSRLKNLEGLENVKIGIDGVWLEVSENDSLLTLEGLQSIDSIVAGTFHGNLFIRDNLRLQNLNGLDSLKYVEGDVEITGNSSLTSISGLSTLNTVKRNLLISNNSVLEALNGLENINPAVLESLTINDNENLSFCSIKSVCDRLDLDKETIVVNNSEGCNDTIEIKEICITNTTENFNFSNVQVYPNPTNGLISIDIESCERILIYDLQGKIVKKINSYYNNQTLDISDLKSGLYVMRIFTNELNYIARITKK